MIIRASTTTTFISFLKFKLMLMHVSPCGNLANGLAVEKMERICVNIDMIIACAFKKQQKKRQKIIGIFSYLRKIAKNT